MAEDDQQPLTLVVPNNNTTAVGDLLLSTSILHRLKHCYADDDLARAIFAGEERHGYVVQRGIIMRYDSDQHTFPCIYIPAAATELQQEIITEYHDAALGGHLGAAKTHENPPPLRFDVRVPARAPQSSQKVFLPGFGPRTFGLVGRLLCAPSLLP